MNFNNYVFAAPYFGWLLRGAANTVMISAMTATLALLVGIPVGILRQMAPAFVRVVLAGFITLFRNMPLVPFLLFSVFVAPDFFLQCTGKAIPIGFEYWLFIVCVALNASGYIADIVRSGLRSIPEGQVQAGRVLGLSPRQVIFRILVPQAVRISTPALGTRLIHTMKNTSVAMVLPIVVDSLDVAGQGARIAGECFAWAEPLVFAAGTYLVFSLMLEALLWYICRNPLLTGREYDAA